MTEEISPRSVTDVFASPAPPVLDMYTYLEQRRQESSLGPSHSDRLTSTEESAADMVTPISEEAIAMNRMSEAEIRELPGGKFLNYSPGIPSNVSV